MFNHLRHRLAILYGISAVVVFALAFGVVYLVVTSRFENFVARSRDDRRRDVLTMVAQLHEVHGDWRAVADVVPSVLRQGVLGIRIVDADGKVVLDVRRPLHRPRLGGRPDPGRRPPPSVAVEYPFELGGKPFGTATLVFSDERGLLSLVDKLFINELGRLFLLAALLALVVFILLALVVARSLARPLERAADAALEIAAGRAGVRLATGGPTEIQGLAASFNDMATSLAEKENLRTKMASDIAHELRTPVTILKGYLEGMADGVLPTDAEGIAALREETARLERIIDDLRAVWAMEKGPGDLVLEPHEIPVLAAAICERFRHLAREGGTKLAVARADAGCRAAVDGDAFSRALSNLLANALRHAAGGRVEVAVRAAAGRVTVEVADDGPGIPADDLPYIFERFYRVDASRSRATGGAGLGLAIAREAVQAMGGTLEAHNNPVRGCTFTITLPLLA